MFVRGWAKSGYAALLLLFFPLGCESGGPALAPVHGNVFFKGAPLNTGTIVFTPDDVRGTRGHMARAEIELDGTYVLRTEGQSGALIGWHRVTVMAIAAPSRRAFQESNALPRSLIPNKYRDPEMSGLTCQIKANQDNVVDFHLE